MVGSRVKLDFRATTCDQSPQLWTFWQQLAALFLFLSFSLLTFLRCGIQEIAAARKKTGQGDRAGRTIYYCCVNVGI